MTKEEVCAQFDCSIHYSHTSKQWHCVVRSGLVAIADGYGTTSDEALADAASNIEVME